MNILTFDEFLNESLKNNTYVSLSNVLYKKKESIQNGEYCEIDILACKEKEFLDEYGILPVYDAIDTIEISTSILETFKCKEDDLIWIGYTGATENDKEHVDLYKILDITEDDYDTDFIKARDDGKIICDRRRIKSYNSDVAYEFFWKNLQFVAVNAMNFCIDFEYAYWMYFMKREDINKLLSNNIQIEQQKLYISEFIQYTIESFVKNSRNQNEYRKEWPAYFDSLDAYFETRKGYNIFQDAIISFVKKESRSSDHEEFKSIFDMLSTENKEKYKTLLKVNKYKLR